MRTIEQLFSELDRYYIQTIAIINQKEDYSERNYKITKMFYDEKIKSLRNEISKRPQGVKELAKFDLERSFIKEYDEAVSFLGI